MAVVNILSLGIWLFVCVLPPAASEGKPEQKNVTAEAGQTVILPCRAPNNNIKVVEWSEPNLEPDYVLLYRDKQSDPSLQHPSFKNRVDLQDRQMKDGDVSLSLKNVTINDTGTYECRVFRGGRNRMKRANLDGDPISIIYLSVVDPPGPTGGTSEDGGKEDGGKKDGGKEDGVKAYLGLIAGITVMVLLVAVISVIVSKLQKKKKSPLPAPPDKDAEQQLV